MNAQLAVLSNLDLILQHARLVSEDNRARLADLARRNILPHHVIRKLQRAGIRVPFPSDERAQTEKRNPEGQPRG